MEHTHSADHPHHSTTTYYIVFVALLALMVATIVAAGVHLGMLNLPIALAIATLKAWLVIWFFMHVKDASPMIIASILSGVVTLLVGFLLLLMDYWTR